VTIRRRLAEHTTLRVGGSAESWLVAESESALVEAVRRSDLDSVPVLVLGGGSNLLVSDQGFPGVVVEVATRGIEVNEQDGSVELVVASGEPWDGVVALAVEQGWNGIEALSGIPGRTGATPIQNVGAYGQDVSQVITSVRALDRRTGMVVDRPALDCGFGYRTSDFKRDPERWVVLAITVRLGTRGRSAVRYAELARALGVEVGDEAGVPEIRSEVLILRSGKGMVLDDADPDTWSAGSFFTNPVVSAQRAAVVPDACPRYPAEDGVKLSAAWLIENAGVSRGFALSPGARAAISSKHTLALTNRGGASAEDVLALARTIRDRVADEFGIVLQAEVRTVGCSL
jgi:UDP-N-acetylmuramate dehydrogenase